MGEQDFKREEADRAFEHLYRRHRVDVYRAAMRRTHDHHEAEDVTQSAFLDAYRAVLRGAEPELPRAWLLAIAENVRRRRFATALRRPRTTPLDHDVTASTSPDQVRIEEIREALAQLPANQRSAFVLREVGGLSYAEIASRLDVSVPAVQMLLFRARQSLRAVLAPSLGRMPGLLAPHWLVGLAARFESASVGARSLGTVGARCLPAVGTAAVAAVAGVATVSAVSGPSPPVSHEAAAPAAHASIPPRLAGVAWARPRAAHAEPIAFGPRVARRPVTPAVRKLPGSPATAPVAPVPTATAAAPTPAVTSAPAVDAAPGDAAPAAPSPAAPTAASGDGERSAPALIPLPTTFGPVELPVQITLPVSLPIPVTLPVPVALPPTVPLPIQVTQPLPVTVQLPVSVPVVEAPSVEVPEVPTLQLPALPVLPVEVGGALPVLPGL